MAWNDSTSCPGLCKLHVNSFPWRETVIPSKENYKIMVRTKSNRHLHTVWWQEVWRGRSETVALQGAALC